MNIKVDVDWQMKFIKSTFNIVNAYGYEDRPFFWGNEEYAVDNKNECKKVYVTEPIGYTRFKALAKEKQDKLYKEWIKKKEVGIYIHAVERMNMTNKANKFHLDECISMCDEIGEGCEEYVAAFIKVLATHKGSHGN